MGLALEARRCKKKYVACGFAKKRAYTRFGATFSDSYQVCPNLRTEKWKILKEIKRRKYYEMRLLDTVCLKMSKMKKKKKDRGTALGRA